MSLRKNDIVDAVVTDFGAQGEGICRIDGMPVFVPYALPGEQLRIQIVKTEKRYAFGRVAEILQPSPVRVLPSCPHYRKCGGCAGQHMTYTAQLRFKYEQVDGVMKHIAGLDVKVNPVLGMEKPWRYRNKITMPVSGTSDQPEIGYFAQRSHRVIDVEKCLLASETADRVSAVVRNWMRAYSIVPYDEGSHSGLLRYVMTRTSRNGDAMVVFVINGKTLPYKERLLEMMKHEVPNLASLCISRNTRRTNVILGEEYEVLWGAKRLEDTLCGNRFLISPLSFFQVNPEQTEKLYASVLQFAGLSGNELVADVYCGAGTISLALAQHAKRVIGIEIVSPAIEDARVNAERNGIFNTEFICGAAEEVLPRLVSEGLRPNVIVLDPPRKGAEEAVIQAICEAQPQRVVYVSCNPATQARDAKLLSQCGYQAAECQPVDMFCQTAGVENVMLFLRTEGNSQEVLQSMNC